MYNIVGIARWYLEGDTILSFKSGYNSEAATRAYKDMIRLPEIHHRNISPFSVNLSSK